jgi:hypothetical protein
MDHKTLTYALHDISEPWSANQQRHLSDVAEFLADIHHVIGKDEVVADALFFFLCFFLCSKEHFSIFFVQYLGVTAGIEPATQQ